MKLHFFMWCVIWRYNLIFQGFFLRNLFFLSLNFGPTVPFFLSFFFSFLRFSEHLKTKRTSRWSTVNQVSFPRVLYFLSLGSLLNNILLAIFLHLYGQFPKKIPFFFYFFFFSVFTNVPKVKSKTLGKKYSQHLIDSPQNMM